MGEAAWMEALMKAVKGITLSDIAISLLGLFIFSSIKNKMTSRGIMQWPVLGCLPTVLCHMHEVYEYVTSALIEAGGSFPYRGMWKGGAFGLVTVDPANIEYILKTNFKNYPKGKYYRERFSELLGDGIFNADDEVWRDQRRAASAEMHSARFVEYSAKTIEELTHNKLIKLAEKLSMDGRSVDLQDVFLRFTFDNICMAAFGVDPGCLAVDLPDVPFARAFEHATEHSLFRFTVPPFVWKAMRYFQVGSEKQLKETVKEVHEFAEKTVLTRRTESKKLGGLSHRSDLLSVLMEAHNPLYTDKFLKDFCISFILAGRDTSSVALAWFFWLLDKNPNVETRILDEIHSVLKQRDSLNLGQVGTKYNIVFTPNELKKMEYLQAALSESLRLYPSVPMDFKEALADDVFPDGNRIKKGARIMYSIYSMGRMESIWGKDCGEFKPERWIKEGKFVSESQFKYAVFNAGPRLCLGKKFAYNQMKMVTASLLLRYSVCIDRDHPVMPKLTTTLYMKNGLRVRFKPRPSFAQLLAAP
ncbi:cytochrome P450 86B1-like [Nymphaea colorata]|nr:cytochrome P450 86B1-like [Nymphaea colorata]